MGHSVRSCVFGMRLAQELGLPHEMHGDLYYALLLKDAGCSSNSSRLFHLLGSDDIKAKRDVKTTDWTKLRWDSLQYALSHVRPGKPFLERVSGLVKVALGQKRHAREMVKIRCERGAFIARRIGFSDATCSAIQNLDELWNGTGNPDGLRKAEIPLFSRIMNLAQTVDVFYATHGKQAAIDVAIRRSGRWFDPDLVRAFRSIARKEALWWDVENAGRQVLALEPRDQVLDGSAATLDNICLAFADVIDAKSPFTYRHSTGVAGAAVAIARTLSMSEQEVHMLRRAALLHDIGKLGVSNSILDKPGKLTTEEWDSVRRHPFYSFEILKRIPGLGSLAEIAASHHEKLDGSGYFRNMTANELSGPMRVLVVADIFDALSAKRPYRDALPLETVFHMMQKDAPKALDQACFEALKCSTDAAGSITAGLLALSTRIAEDQGPIESPVATRLDEIHDYGRSDLDPNHVGK